MFKGTVEQLGGGEKREWESMDIGEIQNIGRPHWFQKKHGGPICPGQFKIIEMVDAFNARGICMTEGCGVEEIIGE